MEKLIIGEGSLDLRNLSKAIENSTSFSVLVERWRTFSRKLDVSDVKILELEKCLKNKNLLGEDIPHEILRIWKASNGTGATLQVLHQALIDCGIRDVAESLEKLCLLKKHGSLISFTLHGIHRSLEELLGKTAADGTWSYLKIYDMLSDHYETEVIPLLTERVSLLEQPKYYVPRSLMYKTEVEKQILVDPTTRNHIFMIKNISKSDLARVTAYKAIDTSGNQLHEVTVEFMTLECDSDFERVCRKTTKPIHVLDYQNNRLFWVKSSQNLDTIQNFLKETAKDTLGEDDLTQSIRYTSPPCALSISDSPGMGKSYLMANMAMKMMKFNIKAVMIFIVLQDFAQTLHTMKSQAFAIQAILNYAGYNDVAKLVLHEMIKSGEIPFYLFLDGYDEVLQNKLALVDTFLTIIKDFSNFKIIATTRPHQKYRLENIFYHLSYEIRPFNLDNQIKFLNKYWVNQHGAKESDQLNQFSRLCLKALQREMSDEELEIAGIPLQCMMLGEVYAEDAVRASTMQAVSEESIQAISFFDMYKMLINLKLNTVLLDGKDSNNLHLRQKYVDAHVRESIILLFPDWLEKFEPYLSPDVDVEDSMIYRIGLIEKIPYTNLRRFVHRTFAECLFAEFLVNHLTNSTFLEFIFDIIFGWNGVNLLEYGNRPTLYELKYRVIAYFIEMHLKLFHDITDYSNVFKFKHTEINARMSVQATSCNDLESCFHLSILALENLNKECQVKLKDKHFRYLPHLVVEKSKNVSLLGKVIDFMMDQSRNDLNYHVFKPLRIDDQSNPWIEKCTPFHVAVYHGKYNFFTCLLQIYDYQIFDTSYLLHLCIRDSVDNKDHVIEDKLSILELLVGKSSKWLNEEWNECKPILQPNVHIKLIRKLVELGANINTYSKIYGTLLHTVTHHETYYALINWSLANGFTLINHRDRDHKSPLMWAIEEFGVLDDEILQLLHEAGADFNAKDKNGDSVLFYCLMFSNDVEIVHKILYFYGADVNHKNHHAENAVHKILVSSTNPVLAIELIDVLKSKGFRGMNEKQSDGQTPLDMAKLLWPQEKALRKHIQMKQSWCGITNMLSWNS